MKARAARLMLLATLCAAALLFYRNIGTVRVAGSSMVDTLEGGDIALVTRWDYRSVGPGFGDVVECRLPGRVDTYIKRVVGLPGDRIAFRDGALYRNGTQVSEPYVSSPTEEYAVSLGGDEYLLLGDNRAESYDSRMTDIGPVGREAFIGRVRWILWPFDRFGRVD